MSDDNNALRKQLLANGYTPLPNIAKACMLKSWPSVPVTLEEIDRWARKFSRFKDTGLRIENHLAALDLDIDDQEAMNDIASRLEAEIPALARAPVRFGKGHKEAWFVRTDEPFGRIHSRRWLAPGADLDKDGSHVVECFGGASPRQFGAFGAHTRGADGETKIAYAWADERSPATTPLSDLPELTKADFFKAVDIAEEELARLGWTVVSKTDRGESEATRVYDLVEDMLFETNTGEAGVTFADLRSRAREGEEGLRVSASFIEPGRGHSLTRCLVGTTHSGDISIWDSATDVTHLAADRAPQAAEERQTATSAIAERLAKLAALESEKKAKRRAQLTSEDDEQVAAGKLLQTYALCPTQQLQVVPIWAEGVGEGMTLTNFRTMMLPWCGVEIGPKGGEKKINPVDIWAASDRRITVAGLRMRPDMPRPTFTEDGKLYVNTYTPIVHTLSGGSEALGMSLLAQLLPDAVERRYFLRWLAFKYRNPAVPGPAVVLVARAHGTGRGTLGELVRRLFGARYVKALDFNTFAGKTYQSQYNTWGAESLMVVVNESSDTGGTGSVYSQKRDTYERLKDLIEPSPVVRHFVRHGLPPFSAPSFTSYLIATNHTDALPLPADDRRFWVGTCGEPREPEFWEEIRRWMDDEANIAAFAQMLEEMDLGDYSPFATPPMTEAKQAMTDLASSSVDVALAAVLAALPGQLVLPEQIVAAMRREQAANSIDFPDRWEAIVRRTISAQLYRLGVKDGPAWQIRIGERKHAIYARDRSTATRWAHAEPEERRREVLRSGDPDNASSVAAALSRLSLAVDNTPKA